MRKGIILSLLILFVLFSCTGGNEKSFDAIISDIDFNTQTITFSGIDGKPFYTEDTGGDKSLLKRVVYKGKYSFDLCKLSNFGDFRELKVNEKVKVSLRKKRIVLSSGEIIEFGNLTKEVVIRKIN